jgi:hypothetical protein
VDKKISSANENHVQEKQRQLRNRKKYLYRLCSTGCRKAAKNLDYNFSGVDAPKNENDLYGLRYDEFVVPL